MTFITSKDNPLIKTTQQLLTHARHRKKFGQTVLEGIHLLQSYINTGQTPIQVLVTPTSYHHLEVQELIQALPPNIISCISDELYQKIRSLGDGVAIMAIITIPNLPFDSTISSDCLIIDGVQDNGNLGTLLRTASAVGFDMVICTPNTAHCYSPKTLRASMGATFSLSIYENIPPTQILTQLTIPMFATSSHSDKLIYQYKFDTPLALVMGHEGQGVSTALLSQCTPIALPQPNGQESLNVGVAGSICLYEILRQRHYT